jgi:hypothetical protein
MAQKQICSPAVLLRVILLAMQEWNGLNSARIGQKLMKRMYAK